MFNLLSRYNNSAIENKYRLQFLFYLIVTECCLLLLTKIIFAYREIPFYQFTCQSISKSALITGIITIVAICALIYINRQVNKSNNKFGLNAHIVANLFANVIKPRFINAIYLFFFVIHLACLSNAIYTFSSSINTCLIRELIVIFIFFGGLYLIVYSFPVPPADKKKINKVFFSGMSVFYPEKFCEVKEINSLNIIPLVKELYVSNKNPDKQIKFTKGDKILVLLSDSFLDGKFMNKKDIEPSFKEKSILSDKLENDIAESLKKEDIYCVLRKIIYSFILYIYNSDSDIIENISEEDIIFTEPCSYNNFKKCYEIAEENINNFEDKGYNIIINSTPGTTTISSVLTLFSIEKSRRLLYYTQGDNSQMEETLENKLSLKTLIDKVSEQLSYSK